MPNVMPDDSGGYVAVQPRVSAPKPPPSIYVPPPTKAAPPTYTPPAAAAAPAPAPATSQASNRPIGSYTSLTGDPANGAIPPGEYNVLENNMGAWENLVGYSVEPTTAQLLDMANKGALTLADFGKYMATQPNAQAAVANMPWANYGLNKDEYAATAAIFGTTFKQVTGQDISPEALAKAFSNPNDPTGTNLLTGSQYQQQLMNDTTVQNTYGWVKYGLNFEQWTQQKLSMQTSFGRTLNDAEAATVLQYTKSASGSNMGVTAKQTGQQTQQPAGVGGSVVR